MSCRSCSGRAAWEPSTKPAIRALAAGMDYATLNVEQDVTVGLYMKHLADQSGALYSVCRGDEPVETDWRLFAALRLRALAESTGTDDAEYRTEMSFTGTQWRRRLRAHAQFALARDDRMVGLIAAHRARSSGSAAMSTAPSASSM